MRLLALIACAGLGIAATAAAAKDDQPQKQQPEEKVICKRQSDADTGSHFATPTKVCRTKAEWRQMEEGAENSLRRIREQGGACPTCLSPGRSGPGGGG